MSFLCLDIGNTRLKWALYNSIEPEARPIAQGSEFLENITYLFEKSWCNLPTPKAALGCSVVSDAIARQVDRQLAEWGVLANWIVPEKEKFGIKNGYDCPAIMGADRWVALIAAYQEQTTSGNAAAPLIVVLAGTATTVEAIDEQGNYLGGLILPGHGIMLKALQGGTARLNVPTGEVRSFPSNASDGLTTGGNYAIVGAIDRMADNLEKLTKLTPKIVMTGGAAWKISPHMTRPCTLNAGLLFEGILLIARSYLG
jgi:type III pantothenate kinase